MKRYVWGTLCGIISLLMFWSTPIFAENTIDSIHVDIELLENGSAVVTQTWQTNTDTGTEFYIPMQHLNHMTIRDLVVKDETGRVYETLDNWNTEASFEDKAYKAGLHRTSNGIEVCWGKSSYGSKTYTIAFVYEHFIQAFTDKDGFNVRLVNVNMLPSPNLVTAKVWTKDKMLNNNNTQIWAFGYDGQIVFDEKGFVTVQSNTFTYDSHLTIMMAFEKDIFKPEYISKEQFEVLQNTAFKGSDYQDIKDNSSGNVFNVFLIDGIVFIVLGFFVSRIRLNGNYRKIPKNIKLKDLTNQPVTHRIELPQEKGIAIHTYFYEFTHTRKVDHIVSAYFLDWIKEGCFVLREYVEASSVLRKPKKVSCLYIEKDPDGKDTNELNLWLFFKGFADKNGYLDDKKVYQGIKKNGDVYMKYLDKVFIAGYEHALKKEYITHHKKVKPMLTDSGKEMYLEHLGFCRYLKHSKVLDRQLVSSIHLWDDYLILATLFGVGKEVLQAFKDLVPDYIFASQYYKTGLDDFVLYSTINHYTRSASKGYQSWSNAQARNSGGGGSASFGGGGGFSGGGVGGGSR